MAWYVFLDPSGPNVLSNSQTQDQRIFWDFIILLDSSYSGENEFQFVKIGARVPYFCLICLLSPNCPKLVFRPETQNVTALGSIFFFHVKLPKILHGTSPYFQILGHFWQSYECLFPENCRKTFQKSSFWCHSRCITSL